MYYIRETSEELGIEIDPEYLFAFDFRDSEVSYTVNVFRARYDGNITPCTREFKWGGWMNMSEVDKLDIEGRLCPDTSIFYRRFKREYL